MLHDSNSIFFTSSLQKRKTVSGKKRAICYALPLFFIIFAEDKYFAKIQQFAEKRDLNR